MNYLLKVYVLDTDDDWKRTHTIHAPKREITLENLRSDSDYQLYLVAVDNDRERVGRAL